MREMVRQEFGQIQNMNYSSAGIMVSGFKLILVPVWVTDMKIHDRSSRVIINGRTGSVHSADGEIAENGLAGWLNAILGNKTG
jgi:flagellar basal body P-ring protein FlgI